MDNPVKQNLSELRITMNKDEKKMFVESNVTDVNEQLALFKGLTTFMVKYYGTLSANSQATEDEKFKLLEEMNNNPDPQNDRYALMFKNLVCNWINATIYDKRQCKLVSEFGSSEIVALFYKAYTIFLKNLPPFTSKLDDNEIAKLGQIIMNNLIDLLENPNIHKILGEMQKDVMALSEPVDGISPCNNTGILN